MAKRNTRLMDELLEEAELCLTRSLADKSRPVNGKSWTYWTGYVDGLRELRHRISGT